MAGLRLGYFVANKKFTDAFLNVLQYPYPLSTITIESGILALEKVNLMENAVKTIKAERQRIIETLPEFLKSNKDLCSLGCNNTLDNAIITAPEKRDPKVLKTLDVLLQRLNK